MDGSDDYFGDDDLVLDESTLAVLDLEEKKWQEQQQQSQLHATGQRRPISQDAPLPAPKKRKTSHTSTPDGLIPRVRAITVGEDYDEDLPDISIIGDGSYKLPAAQRASANELAKQIRGPRYNATCASTSNRVLSPPVRAPPGGPLRRPPVPAQASTSFTRHASGGSSSNTSASGQSQVDPANPRSHNRLRQRHSTLSTIQAALADFIPASANPPPQPTPPNRVYPSRLSPAPGPSRVAPNHLPQGRNSVSSSTSVRPQIQKPPSGPPPPGPATRGVRGSSPSVSIPVDRRHAVAGPSRPRVVSPPQPLQQHCPPLSQGHQERDLRIEVETLKAQVEELLKVQQKTTTELGEARNARYAKEGEVSILRKSIEKTAKDHAAEVARIQTAKMEVEVMQVQLRKEMRDELERMKTQYLFKQHELETARAKTPWTVKVKRIEHHPQPTPMSGSSQRRILPPNAESVDPLRTPLRPKASVDLANSPKRPHRKKIITIPDSPPKSQVQKSPKPKSNPLGFESSFGQEPPSERRLRAELSQASQSTQVHRKNKGKEKAEVIVIDDDSNEAQDVFFNPQPSANGHGPGSPSRANSSFLRQLQDEDFMPEVEMELPPRSSPSAPSSSAERAPASVPEDGDVEMKDTGEKREEPAEPPEPPEPPEPLEPLLEPDWTRELQKIMLTHRHLNAKQPTLQLLIDHALPSTASEVHVEQYTKHCAKLLKILATVAVKLPDIEEAIRSVVNVLCALGDIFCTAHSIPQLAALLNLLKIAGLFIPTFIPVVVAPSGLPGSSDASPVILTLMCNVVRVILPPKEDGLDDGQSDIAREVLGLLEAIAWINPPEFAMRLTAFIRAPDVLSVLINKDQPAWLLHRVLRVFALIASYRGLSKQFLAFQVSEEPGDEVAAQEYSRIPHIERLAAMLLDPRFDDPEGRAFKRSILHFITTLLPIRGVDTNARDILLQSGTLAPSIVLFLMNITAAMYEEDEIFLGSPELVTWTVDTLACVIVLLFHMFKGVDFFTLREKFTTAPKRIFNGLYHVCNVALGRISFCPVPDGIAPESAYKLEGIRDMAKEVLEMVVDGPEFETIYDAFQGQDGSAIPARTQHQSDNESESEARMHSDIEIE
ncbi:hypothetical protein C8Q74DRAFT_1199278 [Fomes fomentarius]|nr:hypothetical protein C8Q74DRAFT_1199278 [Fomes fomentarius]